MDALITFLTCHGTPRMRHLAAELLRHRPATVRLGDMPGHPESLWLQLPVDVERQFDELVASLGAS